MFVGGGQPSASNKRTWWRLPLGWLRAYLCVPAVPKFIQVLLRCTYPGCLVEDEKEGEEEGRGDGWVSEWRTGFGAVNERTFLWPKPKTRTKNHGVALMTNPDPPVFLAVLHFVWFLFGPLFLLQSHSVKLFGEKQGARRAPLPEIIGRSLVPFFARNPSLFPPPFPATHQFVHKSIRINNEISATATWPRGSSIINHLKRDGVPDLFLFIFFYFFFFWRSVYMYIM